jgi:hypothetical protein
MDQPDIFVAALATAPFAARGSSFDKFCGACGKRVMVAPSGQLFLKKHPDIPIWCLPCVMERLPAGITFARSAHAETLDAETKTSVPNLFNERN